MNAIKEPSRAAEVVGTTSHTITLPDPHSVAPGTRFTIGTGEWECVHEGDHAFWEQPITITVKVPPGGAGPTQGRP